MGRTYRSPGAPDRPFETWSLLRRSVRVGGAGEIIAKKLWAARRPEETRDLFDLSLVTERELESLRAAAPFSSGIGKRPSSNSPQPRRS